MPIEFCVPHRCVPKTSKTRRRDRQLASLTRDMQMYASVSTYLFYNRGLGYWDKPTASRHPERSPDFYCKPASFVQMARPTGQGTAHSASATCFCVIYLSSI
ncbi:hypothetical protein Zmor_006945 [Zophobas morio]|uniref:Uncharacterized protein n=1 Tax=Zophobas morio TaxID=2755281 RepID=A0AA38IY10_9CUCU|nr:hypothetical protein Zmor_006945 [Zophobas morio]